MTKDLRCCGTGTCLINADGLCWCGQRWNGDEMCGPDAASNQPPTPVETGLEAAEVEASLATEAGRIKAEPTTAGAHAAARAA